LYDRDGQPLKILGSFSIIEEYRILWETLKSGKEWQGEFNNKKKN